MLIIWLQRQLPILCCLFVVVWTSFRPGTVGFGQTTGVKPEETQSSSETASTQAESQTAEAASRPKSEAEQLVARAANSTLAEELDRFLGSKTLANGPGVAVLVAREGEVQYRGTTGLANIEHQVSVSTDTKFRIGSITKQFTAASILKLYEEGKIALDDKLSKFFPDFPRGDEVTIHHLLTHTSGIASFTDRPDFMATAASAATTEEMLEKIRQFPYDFDPGKKFHYNNSGYFLLGMIIEKVSGQTFNDYLRETFFEPLEMHNTGVHSATAILPHEATGYSLAGSEITKAINWDMSRAGAAGNLYSTIDDLFRWNEGLFTGKVLRDETLKLAWTPVDVAEFEGPRMTYGYGWVIDKHRGLKRIAHGGGLHGFLSFLVRYPEQKLTVVVFHNASPPIAALAPAALADTLAEVYLGEQMEKRTEPVAIVGVKPEVLEQYVGRYDYGTAVLEVTREDDRLFAQLTLQPRFEIFPEGDDKFFWKVVEARVQFLRENGVVTKARHSQNGAEFDASKLPDIPIVEVDDATLDRYVGTYDYPGIGKLTVRRDGRQLKAKMTGQPEFAIYASAQDTFFWKAIQAEATFKTDDTGKVTGLVHRQGGTSIEAKRVATP